MHGFIQFISFFVASIVAIVIPHHASVKGTSTVIYHKTIISTPTTFPSPQETPSITNTPISTSSSTPQIKQYGGWYWRNNLGRAQEFFGTDAQGNGIWTDGNLPSKSVQLIITPANSQNGQPQSITCPRTVVLDKSVPNNNTISTNIIVSGVPCYIFVTPTPESGTFDGTFTYDNSNGASKIVANKILKSCEGRQKGPVQQDGSYQLHGALNGEVSGYVCELFFAPPNTPFYSWPYGAKAVSVNGEEKTFGNW